MKWIAKSHPLPTTQKNAPQVIRLIEQSSGSLDAWIQFNSNEAVFLNSKEKDGLNNLLSTLCEHTILWRIYFNRLLTETSLSEMEEFHEEYLGALNFTAVEGKISFYNEERTILFSVIRSLKNEDLIKCGYINSLERIVSISGLMFLVYLHNDYCLRSIKLGGAVNKDAMPSHQIV